MTSEISHEELQLELPKLSLDKTYEEIAFQNEQARRGKRIIIGCLILMVLSPCIALYFVVDQRKTKQYEKNIVDQSAYISHQENLALEGDQQALIWLANNGHSDKVVFNKLAQLVDSTQNPEIIEAALKSDQDLKKKDANYTGYSANEITKLKADAIKKGSVSLLLEELEGEDK
jgi:predicted RND superfamily exporter protein